MARDVAIGQGVVVNGLAILCNDCSGRPGVGNLEQDFTDRLIGGPGAFVVTANGREAFAAAVRRKLILEISGDRLHRSSPEFAQILDIRIHSTKQ